MYEIFLLASYFVVVQGFFGLGLLVIIRQRTPLYKKFATFAILLGSWQLFQLVSQIVASNHDLAVIFLRTSIALSALVATSFLAFSFTYVGKKFKSLPFYGIGVVAGLLSLPSASLQSIEITRTGIGVPELDLWYGLTLAYAGICMAYGVGLIIAHYKRAPNVAQRSQDRIILLSAFSAGLVVVLASFSTSDFSNSVLGKHIVPLACLGAMLGFVYAIAYRGLFDIHFFVVRAAAYLSTLFAIAVVFVIPMVLVFDRIFDLRPTFGEFGLVVFLTVLVLYALQYVRHLLDMLTARYFFRQYYDPQEVLDDLSNTLVRNVGVAALSSQSAQVLSKAVRPEKLEYMLSTSEDARDRQLIKSLADLPEGPIVTDELEAHTQSHLRNMLRDKGIALAIKLRTTHEDLGFMVLGHKQSGEIYNLRDKRMLSIAADEVAIALQNALRFQQIERFNATLQQKIEEATKKLRRTNERLRVLDQTKDDFISMASHQLRTPLTSVKGYVSMVLDGDGGKINEVQRKLLTQSFLSSQRMVYLISDLLNVSRLKTGKFIIEPVESDLAKVIEEEVEQLTETVKGRGLELTFHKPENFPILMIDETKLRQVIMNFIDNAIYYTPSGGHINVYLVEKPDSIEFTVVDDGIGVPKHEQHHLFSKFYRAHNAKRARPDGTGLGIFMAKKVVIAQGGAVIFKSTEGKGSTFGFTFPKAKLLPTKINKA